MTDDREIERLLEASYQRFAALGIQRRSNDVDACLRYRDGLSSDERARFDALIEDGAFPGSAAETIEITSGRMKPQGAQEAEAVSGPKVTV